MVQRVEIDGEEVFSQDIAQEPGSGWANIPLGKVGAGTKKQVVIEVQALHQSLIAPLVDALASAGRMDAVRQARFVWGVVDVAIGRIESGEADPVDETAAVIAFVDGALGADLLP